MKQIEAISLTPDRQWFAIEYRYFGRWVEDVIPVQAIENDGYSLDGARVGDGVLDVLMKLESRHLADEVEPGQG